MPVSEEETDFVKIKGNGVEISTYGLPLIFWFYALCILTALFFMGLGISGPVKKLLSYPDQINHLIGYSLITFMGLTPILFMGFFFYKKVIEKNDDKVIIKHFVYGICLRKKTHVLKDKNALSVEHFLDSPNVARLNGLKDTRGFQNKGYFELLALTDKDHFLYIDRSSRKADLVKTKDLLSRY